MKSLLLTLSIIGLSFFGKSQETHIYGGVQSILTYNYPYIGLMCKATHERIQGAFYYNASPYIHDFDMGFQLGYNFYNKYGMVIGSNIVFGRYIHFPSLNVLYPISEHIVLDLNLRPSRALFSTEVSILYRFK